MILFFIQILLIFIFIVILWTMISYIKQERIAINRRFFTGFFIGLITDTLDVLGIGSFATTTTFFKMTKLVEDDKKIAPTMVTVHALPVLLEALLFVSVVKIDMVTLVVMSSASMIGAIIGTRVTKHWNTRIIQRILGILLIFATLFSVYRMVTNPGSTLDESVTGLSGWSLVIGICFNMVVGILATMGLGNFAPELIFFTLMGISPTVALPVMMVDAALILGSSAPKFIKQHRVEWNGAMGIVIGGLIGVVIATIFLTQIDVALLQKFILLVVFGTGVSLIRKSLQTK